MKTVSKHLTQNIYFDLIISKPIHRYRYIILDDPVNAIIRKTKIRTKRLLRWKHMVLLKIKINQLRCLQADETESVAKATSVFQNKCMCDLNN